MASEDARWYVVHTYSGYENKVAQNIEKIVENRGLRDQILDVKIPTGIFTEMKDDKKGRGGAQAFPRLRPDQDGNERRHLVYREKHPRCYRLRRPGI